MHFHLSNFPIHLDFCSLGISLFFCCVEKDLNIIENLLITVRKKFQSYKCWIDFYGINFQSSVCGLEYILCNFNK